MRNAAGTTPNRATQGEPSEQEPFHPWGAGEQESALREGSEREVIPGKGNYKVNTLEVEMKLANCSDRRSERLETKGHREGRED